MDQLEQKNKAVDILESDKRAVVMENMKRMEAIDRKIAAIQRSTKTTFPIFLPVHNYMRMHFPWYYQWHTSPVANAINIFAFWAINLIFLALIYNELLANKIFV